MKILFLNHNLIWRGSFFRCLGFARELVKQGHEVDLWTVSNQRNPKGSIIVIDGVRVWQTPRWGDVGRHDGGYAVVDNVCRLLSMTNRQWDVIHAFEHRPNVFFPWLLKKQINKLSSSKILLMADWSDWWTAGGIITSKRCFQWMDRAEQFIEEKSKRWADGVTVISQPLYDRAQSIGIPAENLALIPSGVTLDVFPCLDRNECRKQNSLPQHKIMLGFVGFSLWDMQLLADTFAQIKQHVENVSLMVIGGGVEEHHKDVFRARFTIGEEVFLPGVVPFEHLPQMLGCCDIMLLPLENNPANQARLPNKLMDYFAAGRAVVVTDVGDAPNYVQKHEAGLVSQPNAISMAKTCIELISQPEMIKKMGCNARLTAQNHYSYFTLSQHFIKFYQMKLK